MRTIEVSAEVWAAIARQGKFGETEDDVLRRILGVPPDASRAGAVSAPRTPIPRSGESRQDRSAGQRRQRFATRRMSSFVQERTLIVEFQGGPRRTFGLPNRTDKAALRQARDLAVEFARQNGASYGQEMAVKKALTEAGYHLMK